jgi:multiple antibiotic resistance protein
MNQIFDARFFGEAFVTLVVIMDPPGTVPLFLALTKGQTRAARHRSARLAVSVAFIVITAFAVFGQSILDYLGIGIPALQGAGGLLLLIVALDLLTGSSGTPGSSEPVKEENVNVALVPLGTPLLAGPGAIVATIVFVRRADGHLAPLLSLAAAIVAVHVVIYLAMRFSVPLLRLLRDSGIVLITRVAGLLLSAIAVQLIAECVIGFVNEASAAR